MFETTIIGIIAVLLAYFSRYKNFKYGLESAFAIITVFLAIRYDWGNDYPGYLQGFININNDNIYLFDWHSLQEVRDGEIGWTLLNILFSPLGFFGMVIFLTVIEHYILYRFIKKYVHPSWYWFAIFIYVFSSGFMLTGSSMMRQFLSMCIYIVAVDYIIKRKPIQFTLLVLLAASFHTSAYILLPTYFITYLRFNIQPKHLIFIVPLFYIWTVFAVDIIGDYANTLLAMEQFDKYETYVGVSIKNEGGTGLGVVFLNILFFTCFYYISKLPPQFKTMCIIMSLGFLFTPLASIAGLVGRLGMYFTILSIIIYPIVFTNINNVLYKYFILCIFVLITVKGFFGFFYSDVWRDKFFEYQTIFSAPNWM